MRTVFIRAHSHDWVRQWLKETLTEKANFQPLNIITPNRLAARALGIPKRSLADLAREMLASHDLHIVPALTAQRLLRDAIRQTIHPADLDGTTRTWTSAIKALLQSSAVLKMPDVPISARASQLIQVAQTYQTLLRQYGWVDSSELLWRSLDYHPSSLPLFVYGYGQPTADELAFINAIAGEDSVYMLPCVQHSDFADIDTAIQMLEAAGWQIDQTEPISQSNSVGNQLSCRFVSNDNSITNDNSTTVNTCSVYAYGTLEAEVRGTLAHVKQLLIQGVSARDIGIIVRDEVAYGEKLLDIAWEYDIPLRVLYNVPLSTTRLGGWINLLLDVIENQFSFENTATLLSHPLCSNPDREFWSVVRDRHPSSFDAWNDVSQEILDIDLSAFRLPNHAKRKTWVERIQTILTVVDLRRRCARWARESLALSKLEQSLYELYQPHDEPLSRTEFFQDLRDVMAIAQVAAHPRRGGVELHSPTSVIGAQYSHLFIMGMAEGVLPKIVQNDGVLDFFERKALRAAGIVLLSAAEQTRRESLAFYHVLLTAITHIVCSYPKLVNRQEQLHSPYLDRLGLSVSPSPERPIASREELRKVMLRHEVQDEDEDEVLAHARHAWKVERRRESSAPYDAYDGVTGIPVNWTNHSSEGVGQRAFSVSQLTNLGLCPFKWFADKVLMLGEPDDVEDQLSPSLRGSLYHKALELLFDEVTENPDLKVTDFHLLQTVFKRAETDLQLPAFPNWAAQRNEHLKTLSLAIQQPDFFPDGAEAIALEEEFTGNWHGFQIRGRVDRIDRTDDGLLLIDYKTSSSAPKGVSNADGKACIDLQLSIYKDVAAPALFPGERVTNAYYYSLTKGKKLKDLSKLPTQDELADVAERCQSHLNNGYFPVSPDTGRDACKYCAYDLVCRQGNRLSRKPRTAPTEES
ncbi:MAG: PD-(D/E)XK nuclease family protein [Elainellaceae cyanobacterium]